MNWDEDPRWQEGMWRVFRGAVIACFVIGFLLAIITGDFSGVAGLAVTVVAVGLTCFVLACVCGFAMKALFFLGWSFSEWLGKVARKLSD